MKPRGPSPPSLPFIDPFLFEEVDTTTIFAPRMRGEETSSLDIYDQISQTVIDDADDDSREDQFQIQPTPIGVHGQIVVVPELSVQNDPSLLFNGDIATNILTLLSNNKDAGSTRSSPNKKKRRCDYDDMATSNNDNSSSSCHRSVTASNIVSFSMEHHSVAKKPKTSPFENGNNSPTTHQPRSKWDMRFQELVDYKNTNGHCRVPNIYPENPCLAQWVKRQRYQYKLKMDQGKHSTLSDERLQTLESVGFVWDAHACSWMERWNELKAFFLEHGHSHVPTNYPPNRQLSLWVKCQRRQYKLYHQKMRTGAGLQSNMTEERIRKLESLSFNWKPRGY